MSAARPVSLSAAARLLPVHDLQGNILRGYGFPFVLHLFGRVEASSVEPARAFLRSLVAGEPRVLRDGSDWGRVKPESTVNVGLDFTALSLLEPRTRGPVAAKYPAFAAGMAARAELLADDATPAEWATWSTRNVWVNVHARSAVALAAGASRVDELARRAGVALDQGRLQGNVLPGGDGTVREHFGFRDGLANPAIDGDPALDPSYVRGNGRHDASGGWFPIAPGEFVLGHPDERRANALEGPLAPIADLLRNGTFAVFRDLEQHVERFHAFLDDCAQRYGVDRDFLAHKMMGRTRDGAPLAAGSGDETDENAFHYGGDPRGAGCPLGAHIRRTNPRDTGERRLLRRSLPYVHPDGRRGLYFVAMNASIEEQFEFVQMRWVNGPAGFLTGGRDPISTTRLASGSFAVEGDVAAGRPPLLLREVPAFVTSHGGQYYFVPGISGLRALTGAAGAGR